MLSLPGLEAVHWAWAGRGGSEEEEEEDGVGQGGGAEGSGGHMTLRVGAVGRARGAPAGKTYCPPRAAGNRGHEGSRSPLGRLSQVLQFATIGRTPRQSGRYYPLQEG